MPAPVSATSISIAVADASARTVTLPSGGVWRIAFWIRLNSTRWSCSGLPRAAASAGASSRRHGRPRSASAVGRIASTVSSHQLVEPHLLHRPAQLAALQPRELEQVVDQRAERAHVRAHARRVVAAVLGVDDVVVDRVGEQPQRR